MRTEVTGSSCGKWCNEREKGKKDSDQKGKSDSKSANEQGTEIVICKKETVVSPVLYSEPVFEDKSLKMGEIDNRVESRAMS